MLERLGNVRVGWFTLLEWIPSAVLVPLAYVEVFAATAPWCPDRPPSWPRAQPEQPAPWSSAVGTRSPS